MASYQHCTNCGNSLSAAHKFCGKCGCGVKDKDITNLSTDKKEAMSLSDYEASRKRKIDSHQQRATSKKQKKATINTTTITKPPEIVSVQVGVVTYDRVTGFKRMRGRLPVQVLSFFL